MKTIEAKMKALLVALLLPLAAQAGQHESVPIDEAYIMVCKGAEGLFFVRPSGIAYAMQGMQGAPNCMGVRDTEGKEHLLCYAKESPEVCELAEPGPTV